MNCGLQDSKTKSITSNHNERIEDLIDFNHNQKKKSNFIQEKVEHKSTITQTQPFVKVDIAEIADFGSRFEDNRVS